MDQSAEVVVPVSSFQSEILRLLSVDRNEGSYLAGATPLHFAPDSLRYSDDLDFFHDLERSVAQAFTADRALLEAAGYKLELDLDRPAYIRALISKAGHQTKIEWTRDTAWRFLPVEKDPTAGFVLSRLDLTINKLLALVGRDEPRDYLDVIQLAADTLPLGAQIWAACGKDPGFTPDSLIELCRRKGKYRNEDFAKLHLTREVSAVELKQVWMKQLESAERFIGLAPAETLGCLFYDSTTKSFVEPDFPEQKKEVGSSILIHYGRPGGVLPVAVGSE